MDAANADPLSRDAKTSLFERYSSVAQDVLLKGLSVVGSRYRAGGTEPENGLDCSGFVQFVYREAAGLILPRTAKDQSKQGEAVARADLQPGDLVFFNTMRHAFSHVGIYLGDNYFLHSPSSGGGVRLDNMLSHYWQGRYNGARRLLRTDNDATASPSPSASVAADSGGT
ncbi:MAG: C40 family peptidase [Betaproteobacteria bacterium]|nr:C40 family peptidase [Betaproteobacteria bacterium]